MQCTKASGKQKTTEESNADVQRSKTEYEVTSTQPHKQEREQPELAVKEKYYRTQDKSPQTDDPSENQSSKAKQHDAAEQVVDGDH